jgi:hypothetical protein
MLRPYRLSLECLEERCVPAAIDGVSIGSPTGTVFDSGSGFKVFENGASAPSLFQFATEDGTNGNLLQGLASGDPLNSVTEITYQHVAEVAETGRGISRPTAAAALPTIRTRCSSRPAWTTNNTACSAEFTAFQRSRSTPRLGAPSFTPT